MANCIPALHRRELLHKIVAGLGASLLVPAGPALAAAERRASLTLQVQADVIALRPGEPPTPIWSLQAPTPDDNVGFRRGERLEIALLNDLPVPVLLNLSGIDGVPAAEPLAAQPPLAPGARQTLLVPLGHAGTLLCDLRLLGDGQARPGPVRAVIVRESEAVTVDRDEVLLIEDWRLRPDGTAIAPGIDPKDTTVVYTVNGLILPEIATRRHERLRFRFINGCQRNVIALKTEGIEIRVMAIDGAPSEPFLARNGTLVLAPGTRVDAFIDAVAGPGSTSSILLHDGRAARPVARLVGSQAPAVRPLELAAAAALPSDGLPAQLDLKSALRVDLTLGGAQGAWVTPASFTSAAAPAFRVKAGRTVVVALINRADTATVFHLHGHHFRLLDRLDDGWKPFWLDTLAIDSGQTQRIALAADHAGRWLMEATATDWAAPRLLRWYSVE